MQTYTDEHIKAVDVKVVDAYGQGFEIGLYKKENEYIIYRHAARGKIKNFVGNYEYIDNRRCRIYWCSYS